MAQSVEGAATSGPPAVVQALPWILIAVVFYFFFIRPQNQQADKQKNFLAQLKKGDEVLLESGLFARVFEVRDNDVTVELVPGNTKVRVLKSKVVGSSVPAAKTAEVKEVEKKA
jgi:preprotein translocase subunit YajC